MFDIGFSEIVVIMVVALIVIGPERLPKVARTLGLLWGRAQRYVNGVRADIERDMHLDEVRQIKQKMEEEATAIAHSTQQAVHAVEQQVHSIADTSEPAAALEIKSESIPAVTADSPAREQPTPVQKKLQID
jgi:sec-independent protein translocase protein TatB